MEPYELKTHATFRGATVMIVARCCVSGQWLYDVRYTSGEVVTYVPGRMLTLTGAPDAH